ncbi:MAG TPA: amidohydrolase family protein [Thermoanaerobaculia bacterium]|nr:amidohydrolase family protein [Thermoanaerobaculia bacterium]
MSRLLLEGGTLLGLRRPDDIQTGDLYAVDGTIRALGAEAGRLAAAPGEPVERLNARGKWIVPGFVQAHLHLCQTLLRNGPENLELLPWLERHVWPGEAAQDADTMSVSARLGLAECLAGGVTAVLDMGTVRHTESLFRAAARSGIRYAGGNALMDDPNTTPPDLRATAAEGLAETGRLVEIWHGRERGRVRVAVCPRFAVTSTEELLQGAAALSARHDLLIHTHASENAGEVELVRMRTGMGNIEYLEQMNLLSPRSCVAHGVLTGQRDWSVLADRRTTIVHCPSSNMRLRSGVAPVAELKRAGVRVALGSDGAPCNDRLDPFTEMRLATFLPSTRGSSVTAFKALRMATVEGAAALRLSERIGLEEGGLCDLAILDPEAGWALPDPWQGEPYGAIVYAMGRENVSATIVDGVVRYRASDPTVGGLKPSATEVRAAAAKLKTRMGKR